MTQKDEIRQLHALLQYKNRWYIEYSAPFNPIFEDIAELAKEYANDRLSSMSVNNLYNRYLKWAKEDHIMPPSSSYYHVFMDDIVWDLGLRALKRRDKDLYCESIVLRIKFN